MKKKYLFLIAVVGILALSIIACGSSTANNNSGVSAGQSEEVDQLRSFIEDNLDYTITDLRIVAEDEGYHIVLNALGTPDMLQKLCEDSLNCINGYAKEHDISISVINPIIITSNNIAFGWSTNGTLYSSDKFPIAENILLQNITSTLSSNVDISIYYTPSEEDIAVADEDIKWEIISTQDYIRDNRECIGYRVYINTDKAYDSQYRSIFAEITNDDKYLHTVWFYFSESAADGSGKADVTMEQIAEDITPIPKK